MNTSFRLKKLEYTHAHLPFASPFVTSAKTVEHRSILAITAHIQIDSPLSPLTFIGYGEAAPLPGWSTESIDDCIAVLTALPLNQNFKSIGTLDSVYPDLHKIPTLRAGIELAMLDALANAHNTSIATVIAKYFNPTAQHLLQSIPVQRTSGATNTQNTTAFIARAFLDGFTHIKLKVGVASPDEDLDRISQILDAFPSSLLRLDANSAWSIPTALQFCHDLQKLTETVRNAIDLIEQPVSPANFEAFMYQLHTTDLLETTLKIAPDESCTTPENTLKLIESGLIHAIVLKPATLGGLLPAAHLMKSALENNIRVILSNLLESSIGRHAVAQLAAAFPQFQGPHGLATGSMFIHDITTTPDTIANGYFQLPPHARHYKHDFKPTEPNP